MDHSQSLKLLFIVNSRSGSSGINFAEAIQEHCQALKHDAVIYELPEQCDARHIGTVIKEAGPDRVMAVGGDGTVRLVAESLLGTDMPLAIVPAGSANGMARELGIPADLKEALDIAINGGIRKIHAVRVNGELCIHLCDMGFNAFVVREFEKSQRRGMWGYIMAAWRVFWRRPSMQADIRTDGHTLRRDAAMIVVANATQYGNGVIINPDGRLDDELFEVVVVRKVSFAEIFKMRVTHRPFDPAKTESFHTAALDIRSRRKMHFQVDGEYKGKVNKLHAELLPAALCMVTNT